MSLDSGARPIHDVPYPDQEEHQMSRPAAIGYVPVKGLDMYWESRGDGGVPLVVGSLATSMGLAILPGLTHYNIFGAPQLAAVVAGFMI
jgi:hypothetical protein